MSNKILCLFCTTILSLSFQPFAFSENSIDKSLYKKLHQKLKYKSNITEFAEADIILEQNFTDGDVEVVIAAKGGDVGLKRFWVFSPEGELVYKFVSPNNGNNIGGREILIESPEPADTSIVFDAYPEGFYTFIARSFDGEWLYSIDSLIHQLPNPAVITFPIEDSTIPVEEFQIIWESSDADLFIVELQNEETGNELIVQVPGNQNTFTAPEGWIVPDTEYQISIGVVDEFGNITFLEQTVNTAE